MKIERIINNNIVLTRQYGKEMVVMGRGLGFGKRAGEAVDEDRIEKKYIFATSENLKHYIEVLSDVDFTNIQVINRIIDIAQERIGKKLNNSLTLSLTDHINFALQRYERGIQIENALLWEIRKFYPLEYGIGIKALELIDKELGVSFKEDEAGFIALHVINAEQDGEGEYRSTCRFPKMLRDILSIVRYSMAIEIDEDSLAYERFVVHLKFFCDRVLNKKSLDVKDKELLSMVRNNFRKEFKCAQRIAKAVQKDYNMDISEYEEMYLALHIRRLQGPEPGSE